MHAGSAYDSEMRELSIFSSPIEFPNRDGLTIRGDLHLPRGEGPHPLVLIAHGFKGFKDWGFFPDLAQYLAEGGLAAFRFNFARNGVGEDLLAFDRLDLFEENSLSREIADLEDTLEAVTDHPAFESIATGRPGLFGHSRGGGVAIMFAAREPRIRSLVTWASISNPRRFFPPEILEKWREDGVLHVENARTKQMMPLGLDLLADLADRTETIDVPAAEAALTIPHLIVHGEQDEAVALDQGRELLASSGGNAKLHVVAGTGHTFGAVHPFTGTTRALTDAISATVEHFRKTL